MDARPEQPDARFRFFGRSPWKLTGGGTEPTGCVYLRLDMMRRWVARRWLAGLVGLLGRTAIRAETERPAVAAGAMRGLAVGVL